MNTELSITLNWGLQPEVVFKHGLFPVPPPRTKTIEFPTEFYRESFEEIIKQGGAACLASISVGNKEYNLCFNGNTLSLKELK